MKQAMEELAVSGCGHAERDQQDSGWVGQERRDLSPDGRRRRGVFSKLQAVLEREGMAQPAAREALYNTLQGRAAETIAFTEGAELLWQLLDGRNK